MTADQIVRKMQKRAASTEAVLKTAVRGNAVEALALSKSLMTAQIYSIPEDVTKGGKKKWRRTGHLRRSEKIEERAWYDVAIVNTASYAIARHEAGKSHSDLVKKPQNIDAARISHWREDLARTLRPTIVGRLRSAVLTIMRAGGS